MFLPSLVEQHAFDNQHAAPFASHRDGSQRGNNLDGKFSGVINEFHSREKIRRWQKNHYRFNHYNFDDYFRLAFHEPQHTGSIGRRIVRCAYRKFPQQYGRRRLRRQAGKTAGKSFSEPLPETANEADVKFATQLIAHYAREKNIAVSAIDQTLLVKNILQLKQSALALKTKYNFAPDQELNSSEEQLKNFAALMEGESSFDKVLGISLSEFLETLSDEQLANLFPENFQELKFKKNTAARRPEFPWR